MQMTEMIDVVQQRAGIDSNETAKETLQAVAETLAERDLDGAHDNFAAQLPEEIAPVITQGDKSSREKFDADEFVNRVGKRLGTSQKDTQARTHAALSTLAEAVSDGEQLDLLSALPKDLSPYAVWKANAKPS
ncbi:hypothetical protein GCM10023190_15680 [Enteractinococcus fodinae]|uniref:Uncharacterized protein (DUF2267 family) n=1 Tax=Enteractinococcus fodinae TaxID=684663 RepID=A0ABU2AXS7_9MICC|nr:DUF2267 domain-containing protein [Enteractinococcus fodinae]MDR7345956.1 uncharacterized protein (DUF2267 family) [Enteractinococcus fodinae]